MTDSLAPHSRREGRAIRRIVLAGLAVIALAAPSSAVAVDQPGYYAASPRATEIPGTAEARRQVEIGRSITDPHEYLAFVKSLADYDHARHYGDKR
jgi:hypothetical protein